MLDALKSGRQSCYLVAMIVARLVIRYSANIYLAAICMRPNSRGLILLYCISILCATLDIVISSTLNLDLCEF